jgi:hypothetical protein
MAAILPTVPIEMPDLAGQAFKLQEYRADQKATAAAQREKDKQTKGNSIGLNKLYESQAEASQVLNRFKPETQKAFNEAVKRGEAYSYSGLDSDKNAYLESMGAYNALLGSAKAKTDIFLDARNNYVKNPSQFSITGSEFMDLSNGYANTPASTEEILDINQGVFSLPAVQEFKYLAPEDMAKTGMQLMSNMADTFSPDGVSFNKQGFIDYASKEWLPTMFPANSNAELQAVIYGAQALGDGGLGLLRNPSPQDIQRYAALPQEQKEKFKQVYYNDVMKQLSASTPTRIGQPKEKDANEGIAKQSIPYMDLVPRTLAIADAKYTPAPKGKGGKSEGKGTMKEGAKRNVDMYELPENLFIKTGTYDITGFGFGEDGTQWVTKRRKRDDDTIEIVRDRANDRDLTIIRNKIGPDAYYKYLQF